MRLSFKMFMFLDESCHGLIARCLCQFVQQSHCFRCLRGTAATVYRVYMTGSRVAMAEVVEGNCHAADGGRGTQESAWRVACDQHAPISCPAHRGELEGWQEKMRRNSWMPLPGKPIGTFAACSRVAGTTTPFTMPQLDRITSRRSWDMRVQQKGFSRTRKRAYANLATATCPECTYEDGPSGYCSASGGVPCFLQSQHVLAASPLPSWHGTSSCRRQRCAWGFSSDETVAGRTRQGYVRDAPPSMDRLPP